MVKGKTVKLYFFVLLLALAGCKGQESIAIRQGGGVTGEYETYEIDQKGHVYEIGEMGKRTRELGVLDKGETKTFFASMNHIVTTTQPKKGSGNMTRSLELLTKDEGIRYQWGIEDGAKEHKLEDLFNRMWEALKPLKEDKSSN